MVVLWLFDLGLTLLEWLLSLFGFLPEFTLPASPDIVVPVPLIGSVGVAGLNVFLPTAVLVALALVAGKVLQWLYSLIPFKAT